MKTDLCKTNTEMETMPCTVVEFSEGLVEFSEGLVDFSEGLVDFSEGLVDFSEGLVEFSEFNLEFLKFEKIDQVEELMMKRLGVVAPLAAALKPGWPGEQQAGSGAWSSPVGEPLPPRPS
ncbi:hypothetical protein SFRURICE_006477 [Spodoptera frugiperda]|nr:hypothetical protein SFRURICE_006477 [Spodoptera frugiperda]